MTARLDDWLAAADLTKKQARARVVYLTAEVRALREQLAVAGARPGP